MERPLAVLGSFLFSPSVGSYEQLERRWSFVWAKPDPIGARPLKQSMGPGDEEITISGSIWPEIQLPGLWKIEALAAVAGTGTPMTFMLGSGQIVPGPWCIEEITKTEGEIESYGVPGEITFDIFMTRDSGGLSAWPF